MITSAKNYTKKKKKKKRTDRTQGEMVKAKLYRQNHTQKHTHTHSQKEKKVKTIYIFSPKKRRNSSKQPNLTPKATGERERKKPKVSRRKEIIEIKSEINEKEDGGVEGRALTPSCENPRITTSCWTIINRKTLELTKKDTPHPETKEKPQ